MGLIKPYNFHNSDIPSEKEIEQVLIEKGILADPSDESDDIKTILRSRGITLESVVENINEIASVSKFDNSRLKASEVLLDLHGVRDREGKNIKQPIFNFVIKSETVNLGNIFNPERD